MCRTRELLLQTLIQAHLVRLLRVAPDLQVLDATTFAIQVGGFLDALEDITLCTGPQELPRCCCNAAPMAPCRPREVTARTQLVRWPIAVCKAHTHRHSAQQYLSPCPQELLRTCGKAKGHASNTLLEQMAADVQPLLRPYLESKYALKSVARQPQGIVFSPDLGFRRWLSRWMKQMVAYYATGWHTAQTCLTTAADHAVL